MVPDTQLRLRLLKNLGMCPASIAMIIINPDLEFCIFATIFSRNHCYISCAVAAHCKVCKLQS